MWLAAFDDALAEFEMALRLNPNFSLAQSVHGMALAFSGRWRKPARPPARVRLSPRDPFAAIYYGIAASRPVRRAQLRGGDAAGGCDGFAPTMSAATDADRRGRHG